jgi:splicing factor 3A subunit 2
MRNHLGQYECRLCLTLHKNEGGYLAHTQGKRHQQSLAKRAAREEAEAAAAPAPARRAPAKRTVKIGRPGYRVTKQWDPDAGARSLLFQIDYPEIEAGAAPRHRLMSAVEQRAEATDWRFQYLLFAADPYETVAFKVPNWEVDDGKGRRGGGEGGGAGGGGGADGGAPPAAALFSHWDPDGKVYTLQVPFKAGARAPTAAPPARPLNAGGFGAPGGMAPPPPPGSGWGGGPPGGGWGGPPPPGGGGSGGYGGPPPGMGYGPPSGMAAPGMGGMGAPPPPPPFRPPM